MYVRMMNTCISAVGLPESKTVRVAHLTLCVVNMTFCVGSYFP